MFKRILSEPLFVVFFLLFFVFGCTKLDTTTIGSELIPEVDNINTFADTLDVITTLKASEGIYLDTTKLSYVENYVIGKVNDPLMGATNASLFFQMKPPFYPYYIGKVLKDTIVQADSVVLCLSYKYFWGDSAQPMQLQVYKVAETAHGDWDSVYSYRNINYAPDMGAAISDPKTIDVRTLGNYVKVGIHDSSINQIRIKLSNAFRDSLFSRDTIRNKAFLNDSIFRMFNNGFAVVANSGNAQVYFNLLDYETRLEMHYKRKNGGAVDTTYSNFYFNSGQHGEFLRRSAVSNKIIRTRNTLPIGDQELYLQTNPGTFANLEIPRLTNYGNKIIHRAELQIQQIPDAINDRIYTEPNYVYLDLIDSGTNKWKPIYFDLNPSVYYDPDYKIPGFPFFPSNGQVDLAYYGGFLKKRTTAMGQQGYYNINISKYVQEIATKNTTNYKMRLFPAHSFSYSQYTPAIIPYLNPIAYGRVRVGGGSNPNPEYKMRLRIIYSKVK
ncbi:MAG: DUF4270 family protein [Bacteroidota bacterium]